ncbi:MAG: hypothetical protein LAO31_03235 [Acidobacteriia bacterium]|nr:hypothetical protein [Terriglobia bacterium]
MKIHFRHIALQAFAVAVAIVCLLSTRLEARTPLSQDLFSGMRWRLVGPHRGGRVLTVAGVRGQPNTYYFGAVGGGVWKTADKGEVWIPLFDREPIASIGALAIAPSNPDIIFVGTGEADMRSDISFGDGVYKSMDGGRTWKHAGLKDSRHIGRILVDPKNPDIVLVAALGHAYGPNDERGVFRSTNGGETWQKVLYKNYDTGAVDLCFDPNNSSIVYATLWQTRRPPWSVYAPSSGPGSGLYKSTDGGISWTQLAGHGLPAEPWGRVGVVIAKGDSRRVYALIDAGEGGLYRSDDAGQTWSRVGTDPRIRGRAWYFSGITVDPHNPDIVYVPNVSLYRSTDGGHTFEVIKGAPGGDDYHDLWIDPDDSSRMIVGSDQGAVISVDGGKTWSSWYNQPTAQFYHVATDNQFPYQIYGAQQDSGTVGITSRSNYGKITYREWTSVAGGESGYIVPDPVDPNIVYGGNTGGRLYRWNRQTGQSQDISPAPIRDWDADPAKEKYRFTWTSPLIFSPQDPRTLYFGSQFVLQTADEGRSWKEISPDLSRREETKNRGVVYTIAVSPLKAGEIWAGTDDGLVHLTRDEGKTWENVTPPALAAWSKVSLIEASPHDAGTSYAAIDRHRGDDYSPLVYRTHDYGKTWSKITDGIQSTAFVRAVREDPVRKGLLFAGTETGVYVSFDDGDHWQVLQLNLPVSPIHDLVVHGNDLVVATHGRSFWVLDDITPLRQLNADISNSEAHLFKPAVALRVRPNVSDETPLPPEFPAGQNPPTGASIDYYLKSVPAGDVVLEILDRDGKPVVQTSSSAPLARGSEPPPAFTPDWLRPPRPLSKEPGMHRFIWDLRYPKPPVLRHSYTIAAVHGEDTPALPLGPQILPGEYKVRLTVAGRSYTQPLTVKMDPRVTTSAADLIRQFNLEKKISDAMAQDFAALLEARDLSGHIYAILRRLVEDPKTRFSALIQLDRKVSALAPREPPPPGTGSDLSRINASLATLMEVVDTADRRPTDQAQRAYSELRLKLDAQLALWKEIREKDLPAVNEVLRKNKMEELRLGTD